MITARRRVAPERLVQRKFGLRIDDDHLHFIRRRHRRDHVGQPHRQARGLRVEMQTVEQTKPRGEEHQRRRCEPEPTQQPEPPLARHGIGAAAAADRVDQAARAFAELAVAERERIDVEQASDVVGQLGPLRHPGAADQHRDQPLADAQRRRDFVAHVVARRADARLAVGAGERHPLRPDHRHDHVAGLDALVDHAGERVAIVNAFNVVEDMARTERGGQVGVQRTRMHSAVVAPVADEDLGLAPEHRPLRAVSWVLVCAANRNPGNPRNPSRGHESRSGSARGRRAPLCSPSS